MSPDGNRIRRLLSPGADRSARRCRWGRCRCGTRRSRAVSAARVQEAAIVSAPDDHLAATPHCCGKVAASGSAGGASGCPPISARVISAAAVKKGADVISTPDDHLTAGPDCRVISSTLGCVCRPGGCPTVGSRIISAAGVKKEAVAALSAPDDHFIAGPDCRVTGSASPQTIISVPIQTAV